jgi:hypothetical protein
MANASSTCADDKQVTFPHPHPIQTRWPVATLCDLAGRVLVFLHAVAQPTVTAEAPGVAAARIVNGDSVGMATCNSHDGLVTEGRDDLPQDIGSGHDCPNAQSQYQHTETSNLKQAACRSSRRMLAMFCPAPFPRSH